MSWTYRQSTGELSNPDGKVVAKGYAGGNCGKNPEGVNNPLMQAIKAIGPIVCGGFTFGDPVLQSHLGPFAIPLIPDPANDMMGRGDFFMHGDTLAMNHSASMGCIIMPRAIRNTCAASDDDLLQVVP